MMDADQIAAVVICVGSVLALAIALVIEHRRPTPPPAQVFQAPMSERERRYHEDNSWGR